MSYVSKNSRRRRGTVIVLVVAVLALLAVIGTVFVITSRTERSNASVISNSINLDLARSAVMQELLERMVATTLNDQGRIRSTSSAVGQLGGRLYDIPEKGSTFGTASPNIVRDQPWLARLLYATGAADYCELTNLSFDPAAGTYSISPKTAAYTTVINDPTSTVADSWIELLPFSEASGIRYRFGFRVIDTNRMLNLNVGSPDNFSAAADPTGSYIPSINLAAGQTPTQLANLFSNTDTMANLHDTTRRATNRLGQGATAYAATPAWLSSWQREILRMERPSQGYAFFDLTDEIEFRSRGNLGTMYVPRPGTGTAANLTDIWPTTFSNSAMTTSDLVANPRRQNFTVLSYARELRPYADPEGETHPIYTLSTALPGGDGVGPPAGFNGFRAAPAPSNINVWPPAPARASANPNVAFVPDADAPYYIAMAATNLATAMRNSGFSQTEALSFAANYVAHRSDMPVRDTDIPDQTVFAYYLANGPSFIDQTGIVFRSHTGSAVVDRLFGGTTDLRAEGENKVYLGYSAQPFINEVVARVVKEDPGTGIPVPVIKDSAIELYNPYPHAMSLKGYRVVVDGGTPIDLAGSYIPANGYFVLSTGAGGGLTLPTAGPTVQLIPNANFAYTTAGSKVTLLRAYKARNGVTKYAPVDEMTYSGLYAPPEVAGGIEITDTAADFSLERFSKTTIWASAVNNQSLRVTPTLGAENASTGGLNLQLYSRSWDRTASPLTFAEVKASFDNIAGFNRLMRMTNQFTEDVAGPNWNGTVITTIPQQLALVPTNAALAPYSNLSGAGKFANEAMEAQLHFDFFTDPRIYNTAPSTDSANTVHIASHRFLDHIAMIDRVSDFSIDVGRGVVDINKIRIPGQININTASNDVIRCIPGIHQLAEPNKAVAEIIAYRDRAATGAVSYGAGSTEGAKSNTGDYSNTTNYPGRGFRTLAELSIPINNVVGGTPTTLDMRDKAWASIYNLCTVRSDTFAVYGYIEAVKVHPSAGTHNNGSDWYDTISDSNNTPAKNLRVARRRWVAIVDRSFCNYDKPDVSRFTLPKVVAIKDLAQ
jgi:hypothetical protein